ncbi:ribonuclease Oy isoform X2 [Microplitis demolitor]|uniref:ribonuclease Oy isoform X2 n=1 Tax=Microplitis demolitor TaxID=69319 RepID=UPI0004CD388A|nr:ribonuclease Oy isoform X2 [Microplitis demolitor]
MKVLLSVFLLALILFVAGGQSDELNPRPLPKILPLRSKIDVIVLNQRWLDTACFEWKASYRNNTCSVPKDKQWSLLGLMPQINGTKGPHFCNRSLLFDPEAIDSIKNDLEAKWKTVDDQNNAGKIWQASWEKYGTCGVTVDQIKDQFKYFNKSIELYDKYNMKRILNEVNITPGNNYTAQGLLNAVESGLGKRARILCSRDRKNKKHYIYSIYTCFDTSFNLINCDGISHYLTNCPLKKPITYPNFDENFVNKI